MLRYLDPEENRCVYPCSTKYTYNYYTDDDQDTISNLYACSKYENNCSKSIAYNGTEMKYLLNKESTTCIDKCTYDWW